MNGTPYGVGMSQDDMMKKDQCLLLDEDDNVIGHASKVASHQFNKDTPRGLLHRAFSVFLFNQKGEMLLQQRAASKITFPDVWTNTCCFDVGAPLPNLTRLSRTRIDISSILQFCHMPVLLCTFTGTGHLNATPFRLTILILQ